MFYFSPIEQARMLLVRADVTRAVAAIGQQFEEATGEKVYVIRGWASMAEQAATYADSLTAGYRASPASQSKHPLGAAVDLGIVGHVHDDAAVDQADPLYRQLADIARQQGLIAGYYFSGGLPDPYHVEANEPLSVSQATWAALVKERLWRALVAGAVVVVTLVLTRHLIRRHKARS